MLCNLIDKKQGNDSRDSYYWHARRTCLFTEYRSLPSILYLEYMYRHTPWHANPSGTRQSNIMHDCSCYRYMSRREIPFSSAPYPVFSNIYPLLLLASQSPNATRKD